MLFSCCFCVKETFRVLKISGTTALNAVILRAKTEASFSCAMTPCYCWTAPGVELLGRSFGLCLAGCVGVCTPACAPLPLGSGHRVQELPAGTQAALWQLMGGFGALWNLAGMSPKLWRVWEGGCCQEIRARLLTRTGPSPFIPLTGDWWVFVGWVASINCGLSSPACCGWPWRVAVHEAGVCRAVGGDGEKPVTIVPPLVDFGQVHFNFMFYLRFCVTVFSIVKLSWRPGEKAFVPPPASTCLLSPLMPGSEPGWLYHLLPERVLGRLLRTVAELLSVWCHKVGAEALQPPSRSNKCCYRPRMDTGFLCVSVTFGKCCFWSAAA